jgi:hypothetical protein
MYVLKRISDGKYVAKPGRKHSYTTSLECAQLFQTVYDAERSRCIENEIYVSLNEILQYNER